MTRSLTLALALWAFAGCNADQEAPYIPGDDLAYIDMMIPHHQEALMMADQLIARGERADLKAMAARMKTDQQKEIDQMLAVRAELGQSGAPAAPEDSHREMDMDALAEASGATLDRRFADDMMAHHAGALTASHRALPNLERAVLRELAMMMIDMQAREIGELREMMPMTTNP